MSRTTLASITLSLVAMAAGCRMCASPYDYCGPVFTDGGCGPCGAVRAGSILSGTMEPIAEGPIIPGAEILSEELISVTDRRVDEVVASQSPTETTPVDSKLQTAQRPETRSRQ